MMGWIDPKNSNRTILVIWIILSFIKPPYSKSCLTIGVCWTPWLALRRRASVSTYAVVEGQLAVLLYELVQPVRLPMLLLLVRDE